MPHLLDMNLLQAFTARYPIEGPEKLAMEFNVSQGSLRSLAFRRGLKCDYRKRAIANREANRTPCENCNYRVFDDPLTPEAAYFLGLIQADGWLEQSTEKSYALKIALQESEWELLYAFRDFLHTEGHMSDPYRGEDHHEWVKRFSISNTYLLSRLRQLGLEPNKSNTDPLPLKVPEDQYHHFARGWIDGDGYVGYGDTRPRKVPVLGWLGTQKAIQAHRLKLINLLGLRSQPIANNVHPDLNEKCWKIQWSGITEVEQLARWLHKDGGTHSSRKHTRLKEQFC